jgi:hypothetical protein
MQATESTANFRTPNRRRGAVNLGHAVSPADVWDRNVSRPHVNDAPNVPTDANNPARTPAKVNCSLCTTAALVTYGTGRPMSSGDVALELTRGAEGTIQGNDNFSGGGRAEVVERKNRRQGMNITTGTAKTSSLAEAASKDIKAINDSQFNGIQSFCENQGLQVQPLEGRQSLRTAMDWMRVKEPGTLFGILLENEGHWNVAKVYDNGLGIPNISFADFQTDHPDLGGAPRMGQLPQEGVADKVFDKLDSQVMVFAVTPPAQNPEGASSATATAPTSSATPSADSTSGE